MTEPPELSQPEPKDAEKVESTQKSFKCDQCGGKMEFVPGSRSQECPYCGHENQIPTSEEDIQELDFVSFLAGQSEAEQVAEVLTIKCGDCGAEATTEPNVTSQACPFCGSPVVATAASSRQIKPKSLLPFRITDEESRRAFGQWLSGLWFAPNAIKRQAATDRKLVGIYVPYWTYDCDTTSFYRGQRGEHYWETQHYTTTENGKTVHKTRQVRKTRWYPASGTVWNAFNDVLVLASDSLPRKYTERLEPWDLENLVPYTDEYLSGFRAESYGVDLAEGFQRAQGPMDVVITQSIRRDIGGDEQRISSVKTRHDNITFKHVLLPVWISAYRYRDRVYRFLINARTGEVQGERPWSWCKILLAAAGVAVAIGAAVLAFGHFR